MKGWAFRSESQQAASDWGSHIEDLKEMGNPDVAELVYELEDYASKYSQWTKRVRRS